MSGGLGDGGAENLASVHQCQIESGDRVWGVGEKRFIALPGKGGHSSCLSKNCVSHPGGFGEEFYSKGSRVGLLIRPGCVQGLHSFNLASGGLL